MMTDYLAVRDYLYGLKYHGAKYGIDRMQAFAAALGHPERRFPCIHIAGTNGKGSTAAMVESIYRAAGYRTGLYTSPHLVHQGERVQVDRCILSHEEIVAYANRLRPLAEAIAAQDPELHPSFFEFMTAMAFERFASVPVDVGVIEVGLGGRKDATNVLLPEVSVITSISLDHCELLGDTLQAIAREKAGIIKPGRPVVLGRLPEEAEDAIREVARSCASPVQTIFERFGPDLQGVPPCRLEGRYQRWNAATACLAVEVAQPRLPVSPEALASGLATVSWPARWERRQLADGRDLILDASHNPEGAEMLDQHLSALREESGRRPLVIAGSLGHRRAEALFAVIAKHAESIHLIRPNQPRALSFPQMEAAIPAGFSGPVFRTRVRSAFPCPGVCALGSPGQPLVATGSIYLLGEICEALDYAAPVAEAALQD